MIREKLEDTFKYFVTGLETITIESSGFVFVGDVCCYGYFTSMEEAREIILTQGRGMHEQCYEYVVIEALAPGYEMRPKHRELYEWDAALEQFIKIEEPAAFKEQNSIYCF